MTHLDEAPTPEQHFGAMVRQAREARDWTQETLRRHLAERDVHLEKTAMIRLEQGRRPIRLNEVAALAKLLGLDLQHYAGTLPQLTHAEYKRAKVELERLATEEEKIAARATEMRDRMEDELAELGRERRYLAEQRWRQEIMIGEYEARNGDR